MAAPSADDFAAWRDNPVTRYIMLAARTAAEANKQAWVDASWDSGRSDPVELATLRARADAYMALTETTYAEWLQANGDDDEQERS